MNFKCKKCPFAFEKCGMVMDLDKECCDKMFEFVNYIEQDTHLRAYAQGYDKGYSDGKFLSNKWHDLRKNPDDLPEEHVLKDGYVDPSKYVIVFTENKDYKISRYWGHRRSKGKYVGNEPNDWVDIEFYNNVIAWREIEPFK